MAFKLTGLATNKIKFQVGSLFTGSGYTTAESELIANDDKRRKVALACMYTGHIFSVAFMGLIINVLFSISMILADNGLTLPPMTDASFIVLCITGALFLLTLMIKIPPINRGFQRFLENIAINASKQNRNTNLITVIDYYGKYAIVDVILNIVPEFAKDTPLYEMELTKKYSINVLSIRRGARIVEVTKDTMFRKGDGLAVYGLISDIKEAFIDSVSKNSNVVIINKTNDITLVNNYGSNALVEVFVDEVPEELLNVKMQDAHLKDKYGITIGIIKRKDEYVTVGKDTIIEKGDTVTLFGPYKNIKLLFKNDDNSQS